MPTAEASHLEGPEGPHNECYEPGILGYNLSCGGSETGHWFCSRCVVKLHACPMCRQRNPLYTGPSPGKTKEEDLSMAAIRMLATQNVWAPQDHIGRRDCLDVEWLETLASLAPPPARPPWRPARWQVSYWKNPTSWAPDHEPYDRVPWGSLPLPRQLSDIWDLNPMNIENYRAVSAPLSARLPVAFGWLLGDAEWAMGIVRGAHSHERGTSSSAVGVCAPPMPSNNSWQPG